MHVIKFNAMTAPESILPWRPINAYIACVITLVEIDSWWRTQPP